MKKRLVIISLVLAVLLPATAQAQQAGGQTRLEAIEQRCATIQTILDQTQRRDLVARTNRGRDYEAAIKQMEAFVQRLQHNAIAAQPLETALQEFKESVTQFRAAYVQYDDSINKLRRIDCRNKAADFENELTITREYRKSVSNYVILGNAALTQYRQAVVALQSSLSELQQEGN